MGSNKKDYFDPIPKSADSDSILCWRREAKSLFEVSSEQNLQTLLYLESTHYREEWKGKRESLFQVSSIPGSPAWEHLESVNY